MEAKQQKLLKKSEKNFRTEEYNNGNFKKSPEGLTSRMKMGKKESVKSVNLKTGNRDYAF